MTRKFLRIASSIVLPVVLFTAFGISSLAVGSSQNAGKHTFTPRVKLKNGTSLNWAGYAIETNLTNPQSKAVSDVKGSWIVPAVNCAGTISNTYSATWLGIDGYSDNTVEQTGSEQDCISGQARYSVWYEMYPRASHTIGMIINPGDTLNAEVSYIGNNYFSLTLANASTGKSFTIVQKLNAQRQSAEWIMEAPSSGGVLPLANFGTQTFSGAQATVNNHTGTISNSSWQYDQITMTNSSGTPKATPSPLTPDGSGFSVTWNSN